MMNFDTPEAAEQAFYRAFSAADADAMMQVWDDAPDVSCVHPMGKALHGREAVTQGWREIFASELRLSFTIEPVAWQVTGDLAVSLVYEHIRVTGEDKPRPPMVASHAFRKTPGGWRMIMHHASPAVVEMATPMPTVSRLH